MIRINYSRFLSVGLISLTCFASCVEPEEKNHEVSKIIPKAKEMTISEAEVLLGKAYEAHGGDKYNSAHFEFEFRNKKYTFKNDNEKFIYTNTYEKEGDQIERTLMDWNLEVAVNGEVQELSEKQIDGYSNALNSVIYFATLPHKLKDPSVVLDYQGQQSVKGETYGLLSVKFKEEGGGVDFEDEYMYWINERTEQIDYLAYNYKVNGGGVRFRSAYNKRKVEGIVFQDYINYKAAVGTRLMDLAGLYENDQLKKLSEINTENVRSMNTP